MSKGPGRLERIIQEEIDQSTEAVGALDTPGFVMLNSWTLTHSCFSKPEWGWSPSRSQRAAVVRAMHSFVRKHQQYAIAGGKGRKGLYLYEPDDPASAMWIKMVLERPKSKFVCRIDVWTALGTEFNTDKAMVKMLAGRR